MEFLQQKLCQKLRFTASTSVLALKKPTLKFKSCRNEAECTNEPLTECNLTQQLEKVGQKIYRIFKIFYTIFNLFKEF